MLCSSCSEVVKPVVAIDIDGTLADYHTHIEQFVQSWLGTRGPGGIMGEFSYDGSTHYRDYIQKTYGIDNTTFRLIKLAYRQGGMKRLMPAYPEAEYFVAELQRLGAEVWITTTRPWARYDRVDPDTVEWLRRKKVPYDGLLFSGEKMSELRSLVDPDRVCAVLDDQMSIIVQANEYGWNPILRKTNFNRALTWEREVHHLYEASNLISDLIENWKARNS